jgi:hypothetical protein
MCYSTKKKDKHNERKAKVDRLNSKHAIVTMLEGPAKGEKRKAEYSTLKVWPGEQTVKKLFASGASSASVAEAAEPAAADSGSPTLPCPLSPDATCLAMFGDLNMLG